MSYLHDSSDTDILIEGFSYWGLDLLLSKLEGIFTFVIYDRHNGDFYAARDHLGVKPLYFLAFHDVVYISSELKAFLDIPNFKFKLNNKQIRNHFYHRHVKAPNTLVENIYKLPSASFFKHNINSTSPIAYRSYFEFKYKNSAYFPSSRLLDMAMSKNMISDVPIAFSLSGGFDSSAIVDSMLSSNRDFSDSMSFTISYPNDSSFDESTLASIFSESHNLPNTLVNVTEENYLDSLVSSVYHLEEPVSAPVTTAVYLLSKNISSNGFKVAFCGEGADEVFFGYRTWILLSRLEKIRDLLPNLFKSIGFLGCILLMPFKFSPLSRLYDISWRLKSSLPLFWGGSWDFSSSQISCLLSKKESPDSILSDVYDSTVAVSYKSFQENNFSKKDHQAWMSYCDLKSRLPELLMNRLDKMFMAHSIEGRVPFLDHVLVSRYLSTDFIKRNKILKYGKDYLRMNLLKSSSFIPKRGFQAPVSHWIDKSFGIRSRSIISDFAKQTDIFDSKFIPYLFKKKNRLYFSVLFFVIWYCNYIEDVIPQHKLKFTEF